MTYYLKKKFSGVVIVNKNTPPETDSRKKIPANYSSYIIRRDDLEIYDHPTFF